MKLLLLLSCFTLCSSFNILDPSWTLIFRSGKNNKESQCDSAYNGFCGVVPKSCPETEYRSIDGSCNNLIHPSWGTPNTSYVRLCPNNYGDGISSLPTSKSRRPLKSARDISRMIVKDKPVEDKNLTLLAMQLFQMLAHDMSHAAGLSGNTPPCCKNGQDVGTDSRCANIPIPQDDTVHSGQKCLNFVRTLTTRDNNCTASNVTADPLNTVTSFIDASFLYGSTNSVAKALRSMYGGRMKTVMRNGLEWPPPVSRPTQTCNVKSDNDPCYMAGDKRVNQNTQLTMLHILLLLRHNQVADNLHKRHKWSDEKIYQETRRISIACFQRIIYYELLPKYLGHENMLKKKLIYDLVGFINDYDPNANPGVSIEYASVASRFLHSAIAGTIKMYLQNGEYDSSIRLSSWMNNPSILEKGHNFEKFERGSYTQPQMALDPHYDNETTTYLFRGNNEFGTDIVALDIQRARDHGAPTYNDLREYCGLPRAKTFSDFCDHISKKDVELVQKIYKDPNEVEALVGGAFEIPADGAKVGHTFLCIIMEQFHRTRRADRFFFESLNSDGAFTVEQLSSIHTTTVASLFCDVGGITSIQRSAFELPSETNPVVSCDQIPTLDLSLWDENPHTTT